MKPIFTIFFMLAIANTSNAMIYHLITASDLKLRVKNQYIFEPSLISEGFTHNATLTQVVPAADRHYKGMKDTLLLAINERFLRYPLRYDYVERHNEYFPHIYGPINLSAVVKVYAMPTNTDGSYRLPQGL